MGNLIIGTYTHKESKGLYDISIDQHGQAISEPELVVEDSSPTYAATSHDEKYVYTVSEADKDKRGNVGAYKICGEEIKILNQVQAPGAGLVHLALDHANRYLFAVSYRDASIQMYSLNDNGSLGELVCEKIHTGKGINPIRQEKAHAHSVWLSPEENYLCVCDLGIDQLRVYDIDYETGTITDNESMSIKVPDGFGPRHLVFHPNGKYAYLICELASTVLVLSYDRKVGFSILQTESTLITPNPESSCAAIRISTDGNFLYASNRGDDSIAIYEVIKNGATINRVDVTPVKGKHPRDFILCQEDSLLLCANRDTDSITVFARNAVDGKLQYSHEILGISMPVSLLMH